jgi:hypothetical protein
MKAANGTTPDGGVGTRHVVNMQATLNGGLFLLCDDGTMWYNGQPQNSPVEWRQVRGPAHFPVVQHRAQVCQRLEGLLGAYDDEFGLPLLPQVASILKDGGIDVK